MSHNRRYAPYTACGVYHPWLVRFSAMHPLLARPTPEQARLLEVIHEGRARLNPPNYHLGVENDSGCPKWPFFQYVEHTLYRKHRLNALVSRPLENEASFAG
jgi:hypothetical protein